MDREPIITDGYRIPGSSQFQAIVSHGFLLKWYFPTPMGVTDVTEQYLTAARISEQFLSAKDATENYLTAKNVRHETGG